MLLAIVEEKAPVQALQNALPLQVPSAQHAGEEEVTQLSSPAKEFSLIEDEGAKNQSGPLPTSSPAGTLEQATGSIIPGSWLDEEDDFSLNLSHQPGFFDFVLTHTSAKALWEWLQALNQAPLRAALEREGSGAHLPAVSRPLLHTIPVRRRLLRHLVGLQEAHPTLGTHLLWAWKNQRPVPAVLQEVGALTPVQTLEAQLPRLHARHGGFALTAALFVEMRRFTHVRRADRAAHPLHQSKRPTPRRPLFEERDTHHAARSTGWCSCR